MKRHEATEGRLPSRRQFLTLGMGAFVVAAVPLAVAQRRALVRRTLPVMGTIAELGVVHRDPRYAHGAIDAAFAELTAVERVMSRFDPRSEIGQANLYAACEPVIVSAPTAAVIVAAAHWATATDGGFDPCLGGAVALWDVAHRQAPPAASQVRRYADRRLYRALELDRRGGAAIVRFHEADIALDLGGIAKGYAVDRAVGTLRAWGIRDALVNVGGDLYALGVSADGDPWEIGIRSPADASRLTGSIRVTDRAIATSGDYEQFFDHAGRRYHHLMDPTTGAPRRAETHSLTIAADDCMSADAAATALFGRSPADTRATLARLAPHAEVVQAG
jgi:thiamine biosynthesis lipoprotein